jgi:hypothetical protein
VYFIGINEDICVAKTGINYARVHGYGYYVCVLIPTYLMAKDFYPLAYCRY